MKKRRALSSILLIFFLWGFPPASGISQQTPENLIEIRIQEWLLLGPFTTPLPALHREYKKGYAIEGLVRFNQVDLKRLRPESEKAVRWHDGTLARWREIQSGDDGVTLLEDATAPTIAYLAVYIEVKRWTPAKILIQSSQALRICLDGKTCATRAEQEKAPEFIKDEEIKKISTEVKLETGKHWLLIKSVYDPASSLPWRVKGSLIFEKKYASPGPSLTLSPAMHMTITHLLEAPAVVGIAVSPDGKRAAVSLRQTAPSANTSESWVEMYDIPTGRRLQTYRGGMTLSALRWGPDGRKFSYTTRDKTRGTIWVVDLEEGTTFLLVKNIKGLGTHLWSPDGRSIVYSVTEEGPQDKKGIKRFKNLSDRLPGWRNRTYLYKVSVENGFRQRLTGGEFSTILNSISPDGKKLLFSRTLIDYSERPFSKTELYTLDLLTLKTQLVWEGKWFKQAQWSPDGDSILILGGPSTFGPAGINVPRGLVPNEFDTQAYIYDPESQKATAISREFKPSIEEAFWSHTENAIYFIVIDHSYRRLYRYDLEKKSYLYIHCGVDAIEHFDLALNQPVAGFTGSSPTKPSKAYILDVQRRKTRVLIDPAQEEYAHVSFGDIKRWTFKNAKGRLIDGRVYYPPDFDPEKKYPCIVYFYGGTTPTTREFGGRYPKNLWAAMGYIVYVLQPSGAVGYGQDFSALHVNDWGFIVADEIIDGVRKFLSQHPFVDPKKVGCIGASYGGFLTMLIQTRTNIFSAAIAHAGISSISSYWGEGYYGFWYSAYAAANSFPWNRKDIFINQSALFNADKITTPILLLHGSKDTNVPPGESTQLFTALKILGREVEYIQILDQDHHIIDPAKRQLWTKTIIAWFDRWLKDQPEWWYSLYPEK